MGDQKENLINQANIALEKKEFKKALEIYKILTTSYDPSSLIYTKQGQVQLQLKYINEAESSFQKAVELDTNNWQARVLLGNLLFNQGKILGSIIQFKEAIGDNKIDFMFDSLEFLQENSQEQNQKVLKDLNNILSWDTYNCRALIFRGIFNIKLGNFSAGLQDFNLLAKNENNIISQIVNNENCTYVENRLQINYKYLQMFIEEHNTPQPDDNKINDYGELNKEGHILSGQMTLTKQEKEALELKKQQEQQEKQQQLQQQQEKDQLLSEIDVKQSEKQSLLSKQQNSISFQVKNSEKQEQQIEVEKPCCSKCIIF